MKGRVFFRQAHWFSAPRFLFAVNVVLAVLFAAPFAGAQSTGGRILGTVTDPTGGAVVGASVTLINEATHATRIAQTGATGEYIFVEVPVGSYEIDAVSQGFKKYVRKGIPVNLNEAVTVDMGLQVGGSTEVVEVSGTALVVDTSSTQLGAVMTETAVRELPLNARNTYQLLQLQPGVQSTVGSNLFYGSDQPGVVSVNGGRGRSNNFTVNGGDANDLFVNLPGVQPSPDAISEFRVLTNTFDAEYGRNSGAIVNVVTKSGTNDFHGDVYEFFRNKILNANDFFLNSLSQPRPDFKQNQFGGTLGGPIKKDKTFFFASYEAFRLREGISSGIVLVPTSDERKGNFSAGSAFGGTLTDANFASILAARTSGNTGRTCQQAVTAQGGSAIAAGTAYTSIFPNNQIPIECFDATALDLMNQFVPQPNATSLGSNTFIAAPVEPQRTDQFTARLDHKLSASQQLSAYFYFSDDNHTQPFSNFQAAGANVPGFQAQYATRNQQLNLTHTWTLGASAVNEFRFAYYREGQGKLDHPIHTNLASNSCTAAVPAGTCFNDPTNPRAGITPNLGPTREGVPFITLSGGFAIGNNFEGELPQVGNSFQWSDAYSKVIGKHSLKFGADVRRYHFDQTLYFDVNGEFFYFGGGANDTVFDNFVPNYLLGLPDEFLQGSAQVEKVRSTALYLYAQDSWKLTPNVTLNYGLRWEFTTPITDVSQHVQTFRPGQATTIYPCKLGNLPATTTPNPLIATFGTADCTPGGANATPDSISVFPLGLVVPGDKGVQPGLTQNYYKSFAPRIGLAYSPGWTSGFLGKVFGGPGHTSFRMGYGIFYNPVEQLVLEQFSAEPPFGGSTAVFETLFNTPFQFQSGGPQAPNPFNGILNPPRNQAVDWSLFRPILLFGQFQPKMRSQYSEQYNLTIERQLGKDMLLRVGYVGSQGHRLLATHDLNFANRQTCQDLIDLGQGCGPFAEDNSYSFTLPAGQTFHLPYAPGGPNGANIPCPAVNAPSSCVITPTSDTPITLVGIRPYSSPFCNPLTGTGCPPDGIPVFSNIFAQDTIGNSNYNSLQASVQRNLSKGLQFLGAYTFSKSIDDSSSFESILNPIDFRKSRSLSLFDARHRFVLSSYWELPIPKHDGFAGKLANGWALSGILTYQTGFPIRILDGDDTELLSSFDFEPVGQPFIHGQFRTMDPRNSPNHTFFDPTVFSDPTTSNAASLTAPCDPGGNKPPADPCGVIGNASRSYCCGPAISQTDLSILKRTAISEKFDTEFRAEFFNTWNHTQFLAPDGNFTNGFPPSGTFGTVQKARDPRLIQFALKLYF